MGSQSLAVFAQAVRDTAIAAKKSNGDMPSASYQFREFTGLSSEEASLFVRVSRTRLAALLEGLSDWAITQRKMTSKPRKQVKGIQRVRIGAYLLTEHAHRSK